MTPALINGTYHHLLPRCRCFHSEVAVELLSLCLAVLIRCPTGSHSAWWVPVGWRLLKDTASIGNGERKRMQAVLLWRMRTSSVHCSAEEAQQLLLELGLLLVFSFISHSCVPALLLCAKLDAWSVPRLCRILISFRTAVEPFLLPIWDRRLEHNEAVPAVRCQKGRAIGWLDTLNECCLK